MLAHIQANYLGTEIINYNIDGKNIVGRYIGLQNPASPLQILRCTYNENLDLSAIVKNNEYLFVVDIPLTFTDKTKLKVVEVVPFKVDKTKVEK